MHQLGVHPSGCNSVGITWSLYSLPCHLAFQKSQSVSLLIVEFVR